MEKRVATPPWKTLRVFHFPTATATAMSLSPGCRKARSSYYDACGNRGQVRRSNPWENSQIESDSDQCHSHLEWSRPHAPTPYLEVPQPLNQCLKVLSE